MTSIPSAIASLLYDHDVVIVPGLGAFKRHNQSARVNVITNEFHRPSSFLEFNPQQREENTVLISFLMACDGITEDEARTALASFVSDCFTHLKDEGTVALPEIGALSFDDQRNLVFDPAEVSNFNSDAFGLGDFNAQPVYGREPSHNGAEVKKGDPKDATTEPDEEPHRRMWWIWVLLFLAAAGVSVWYFMFRPIPTKPWPVHPVPPMAERVVTKPVATKPLKEMVIDSLSHRAEIPMPVDTLTIKVVAPEVTSNAFIVGGCFSVEENALNMMAEARDQGCVTALVMKRGSKYYVCYGQYPNTAVAKTALPEVLDKYNPKAWILTK